MRGFSDVIKDRRMKNLFIYDFECYSWCLLLCLAWSLGFWSFCEISICFLCLHSDVQLSFAENSVVEKWKGGWTLLNPLRCSLYTRDYTAHNDWVQIKVRRSDYWTYSGERTVTNGCQETRRQCERVLALCAECCLTCVSMNVNDGCLGHFSTVFPIVFHIYWVQRTSTLRTSLNEMW